MLIFDLEGKYSEYGDLTIEKTLAYVDDRWSRRCRLWHELQLYRLNDGRYLFEVRHVTLLDNQPVRLIKSDNCEDAYDVVDALCALESTKLLQSLARKLLAEAARRDPAFTGIEC